MPRINAEYKQDAKKKIISAALIIAVETGWDGVTLEAIARTVGVTKPALYVYFESREALLHEVILEVFQSVEMEIADMLEDENDVSHMIQSLAELFFEQQKPYATIFYQLPAHLPHDSPFREKFIQIYEKNRVLIRDFLIRMKADKKIPQGLDPEAIATGIIAMTTGLEIRSHILKKDLSETKRYWIHSVEQMLHVEQSKRKRPVS